MILDSSAIVAIALGEPEQSRLLRSLFRADAVRISAPTWLETSMVLAPRLVERTTPVMEGILKQFSIEVVPFGIEHAAVAMDAWKRFGRGHHPARLNFGDCISYATARVANEPLLFAGDDFAKTDIVAA